MQAEQETVDDLIRNAQEGDERAMTEVITLYKGLVFTILFRMTNDYDASEDLAQETFIKAFMNIRKVKSAGHLKPWLCTIARNVARDHLRKTKRRPAVSLEEIDEVRGRSNIEITRRRVIIQQALAKLPERDRLALTLMYYQGSSLAELAEVMKLSENAVKVCVHRARKRLREQLKGYEDELLSAV